MATKRTQKTDAVPAGIARADASPAVELDDQVARLAYSYWEGRGGQGGSPEEDWFRAEQEVRSQTAHTGAHARPGVVNGNSKGRTKGAPA